MYNKGGILRKYLLGLVAISGLSFWFFLGFPFANHNESYVWLPQLNDYSFIKAVTHSVAYVANPRPIGIAVAWLGYKLSGGSIVPIEVFNYIIAAAAWFMLFLTIKEKRIFSLAALITCGVFFSGYIYLFHLHGVFYSPVLLLISTSLLLYKNGLTTRRIVGLFLLAVIVSLFHPFALPIYLSFILGILIKRRTTFTRAQICLLGSSMVLGVILLLTLVQVFVAKSDSPTSIGSFSGLISSYKMVESNKIVSITAILLAVATLAGISIKPIWKISLIALILASSVVLYAAGLPVIFAWVLACLIKSSISRNWIMALLTLSTLIFPQFAGTGSPTYSIFLLMVCAAQLPIGWNTLEQKLGFIDNKFAAALSLLILISIILLKQGVNIPVLSTLANPLMAEQEKTFQLEKIIQWTLKSKYKNYDVLFYQDAGNPTSTDNAVNRIHRPPTTTPCLNSYLSWRRHKEYTGYFSPNKLMVTFGNDEFYDGEEIYKIKSKHAGDAVVYLAY